MTKRLDKRKSVFEERMKYAKLSLQEVKGGSLSWGELEKRFFERSGSHSKFISIMRWLIGGGYIIKEGPPGSRAPYRINLDKVRFNEDGFVTIKIS